MKTTITPAKLESLKNFVKNYLGKNILQIDQTWNCCKYQYRFFVENCDLTEHRDLLHVLEAIFGGAIFFDSSLKGYDVYLCGLKEGCENIAHLYNK